MSERIFKMSSCGSYAGMETLAPLVNGIVNNVVFHSDSHQSGAASNYFHPDLLSGRLLVQHFLINWTESRAAVRWPQIWKFIRVTTICQIISLSLLR